MRNPYRANSGDTDFQIFCTLVALSIFIIFICYKIKEEYRLLKLAKTDFRKYQEEIVKKQKEREGVTQQPKPEVYVEPNPITPPKQVTYVNDIPTIPCPVCGSRDTNRIGMASRVVSTSMFGLASNKIGKQYKCNNCKHMW